MTALRAPQAKLPALRVRAARPARARGIVALLGTALALGLTAGAPAAAQTPSSAPPLTPPPPIRPPPATPGSRGHQAGERLPPALPIPQPDPATLHARWHDAGGELLVLSRDASEAMRSEPALDALDYVRLRRHRLASFDRVLDAWKPPGDPDFAQALAELARVAPSAIAGPNQSFRLQGDPAPTRPELALVSRGPVDAACGSGVTLGLLDTRPDENHRALRGARIEVERIVPISRTESGREHATAIAALLVGRPDVAAFSGLAPGARLVAAGVFARAGGGVDEATTEWIALGLDRVAARGARVVNLSFGGPPDAVLAELFGQALARGLVLVAAVGNDGPEAPPRFPASLAGVVGVTAVDAERAIWLGAPRGEAIDLAAPGADVFVATKGAGAFRSGTSYAAPFVSAALARAVALRAPDPVAAVEAAAVDLGATGRDPVYGVGLVQLGGACPAVAAP